MGHSFRGAGEPQSFGHATGTSMKCFIASAFGHTDVDAIYDDVIRPVLASLQITPLRVDRVEHNEDIDDKIFQLLDSADLCIADLTFARPSVYYEAGYANGLGKPVVYLVRRDHFDQPSDSSTDTLRVHFDLQMKNIIPWTTPTTALRERLRRRLVHVSRPHILAQQERSRVSQEESAFAQMSLREQSLQVTTSIRHLLHRHGFSAAPKELDIEEPYFVMRRIRHSTYHDVHLVVHNTLKVNWVRGAWSSPSLYQPLILNGEKLKCTKLNLCLLLVVLGRARISVISDTFRTYRRLTSCILSNTRVDGMVTKTHSIVLLDSAKSVTSVSKRVKATLGEMDYL